MNDKVIIITGAVGFLGSAIAVDLSRDYKVVALDIREPGQYLLNTAPAITWITLDVSDAQQVGATFQQILGEYGRIDIVIHLAAFYHFGTDWHPEYGRTNTQGMSNILQAAKRAGVRRMIFASSIAAMEPPMARERLTERTPTSDYIPYAKSKSIDERMLAEVSGDLPVIVLRIGGVFSDWCELPALHSLIKLWSGHGITSRLMPGRGVSGMPYIHRDDFVQIVRRCLEVHETLGSFETFLASQDGATLHGELFPIIREAAGRETISKPISLPPALAGLGLYVKLALGRVTGNVPYEEPWMLRYIDHPWVVDTTYTRTTLAWDCSPGLGIWERLPLIVEQFTKYPIVWEERNVRRNERRYVYSL